MIFANHAHVFPAAVNESGTVGKLKKVMDECEIDKAVAFAPFQDMLKECGMEENANIWLYEQIKNDASLVGFGTVDFDSDNLTDQVERIYQLRGIYSV